MKYSPWPIAGLLGICLTFGTSAKLAAADDSDPAAELASFQIAEGFEAKLFASETDGVVKPIQIRFDARGRLWVIGSSVYPQIVPGQIPNDKVLVLEDTNHDGRCDKVTVFADGLMIPTGLELADGGAYVGHGTELLFLKDNDGDGKADERRVVLRGFGTGDNHQNINSFLFGPGGELWMCQGLHTHSNIETPWGIVRLHKAGLWRFHPSLKKLEGFYGSENEPQNPWGYVFNDWGEPIVIAGNNSSAIYPVPGLVVDHLDLPPALIWKNGQGRKSSGADIVGTTHFPEAWQGVVITGGYINNAVWALKITDDGSGFALQDLPPLIRSSNRSFRPVDVKFGPDGALYIADWYNPIIGHYQASFRDPNRDKIHGRIWRVTAKGRPLTEPPLLATATLPQLFADLKTPDRWTRRFAKRVLADRPKAEVLAAATAFLSQNPQLSELALKEILGVYQSHESPNRELLERLCHAADPGARAYAASVAGSWGDRISEPLKLLAPLALDENPRVRLQAIVASTYVPSVDAISIAASAAEQPNDKFIDYALKQAVHALKPLWLEPFQKQTLKLSPSQIIFLAKTDATADVLGAVRELWLKSDLAESNRPVFLRALLEAGTGDDFSTVLKSPYVASDPTILPTMITTASARKIKLKEDPAPLLRPLIASSPTVSAGALRLVGVWKVESLLSELNHKAFDSAAPGIVREKAIEALSDFPPNSAVIDNLVTLIASDQTNLRTPAFNTLLALNPAKAIDIAAAAASANTPRWNWDSVFIEILQHQTGATSLAQRFVSKPPAREVGEIGLRIVNSSGRRDDKLAAVLAASTGASIVARSLDSIPALAREVREQGRASNGEAIFRRAELGCLNCHSVKGQGGKIGPDLSVVGAAQPIEFIIGAILDPQKEIKEGYVSTLVSTKDDQDFQGYVVRENAEEIVLQDTFQNRPTRIPRSNIKVRKESGSLMPNGLTDSLSDEDFIDLVCYLSELGH